MVSNKLTAKFNLKNNLDIFYTHNFLRIIFYFCHVILLKIVIRSNKVLF